MAKPTCKCKETACEECPEWIFTFADLVMLMMGFFVILWVLKPPPGKDGEQDAFPPELVDAIKNAFAGTEPDPNTPKLTMDEIMKKLSEVEPHRSKGRGGQTEVERVGVKGRDELTTSIRPGKQITRGGTISFAPGQAGLSPDTTAALADVVKLIKGHKQIMMLKGHADAAEEGDARAKMDLSMRRAQAVADYLVSQGVDRETLRVQGCSTYEPLVTGVHSDAPERGQNRRVEVEATANLVSEFKAPPPTATQPSTTKAEAASGSRGSHAAH